MERDILFVFEPGFTDRGLTWFCPYSAQVVGFLVHYPEVRATLDVREIDFLRYLAATRRVPGPH